MQAKDAKEINLRFFGPMVGIVGRTKDFIRIDENGTTIKEIVVDLCKRYGEKFEEIALNNGEINTGLIVFVNGVHVTDEDRKILLTDAVQIMIASQMKGG